jgi:hypothetical protein
VYNFKKKLIIFKKILKHENSTDFLNFLLFFTKLIKCLKKLKTIKFQRTFKLQTFQINFTTFCHLIDSSSTHVTAMSQVTYEQYGRGLLTICSFTQFASLKSH